MGHCCVAQIGLQSLGSSTLWIRMGIQGHWLKSSGSCVPGKRILQMARILQVIKKGNIQLRMGGASELPKNTVPPLWVLWVQGRTSVSLCPLASFLSSSWCCLSLCSPATVFRVDGSTEVCHCLSSSLSFFTRLLQALKLHLLCVCVCPHMCGHAKV